MNKQARLTFQVPVQGTAFIGVEAQVDLLPESYDEVSITLVTRMQGTVTQTRVERHVLQQLHDELGKVLAEIPKPTISPIISI